MSYDKQQADMLREVYMLPDGARCTLLDGTRMTRESWLRQFISDKVFAEEQTDGFVWTGFPVQPDGSFQIGRIITPEEKQKLEDWLNRPSEIDPWDV